MTGKIGFGGSCHWCTEAIFQSLKGVIKVEQGWIASHGDSASFSEAVIVYFDTDCIDLKTLIDIHLQTHSCTSAHTMRSKYRSAVYTFTEDQIQSSREAISSAQEFFDSPILTEVIPFQDFRLNHENYLNYYYNNPNKPFCQNKISPKLRLLMREFSDVVDTDKLNLLAE